MSFSAVSKTRALPNPRRSEFYRSLQGSVPFPSPLACVGLRVCSMLGALRGLDFLIWIFAGSMHRLTARFLLLFAVVGNLVPLALASAGKPPHACCVRKAAHPCHGGAVVDSSRLSIHDAGCGNHECCRAVTTAQWAHPQTRTASLCRQVVSRAQEFRKEHPIKESFALQSTRAPPYCSLA